MTQNLYSLAAGLVGLSGLQVVSSLLATKSVPVRPVVVRPWMNGTTYHKRIAKKWLKRYGTKQVPTAYVVDTGLGPYIVAHPDIVRQLQER